MSVWGPIWGGGTFLLLQKNLLVSLILAAFCILITQQQSGGGGDTLGCCSQTQNEPLGGFHSPDLYPGGSSEEPRTDRQGLHCGSPLHWLGDALITISPLIAPCSRRPRLPLSLSQGLLPSKPLKPRERWTALAGPFLWSWASDPPWPTGDARAEGGQAARAASPLDADAALGEAFLAPLRSRDLQVFCSSCQALWGMLCLANDGASKSRS